MPRHLNLARRVSLWAAAAAGVIAGGCASLNGLTTGGDGGTHDGGKPDSSTEHQDSGGDGAKVDAGAACVVGGKTYASGSANPTNACQGCQPAIGTTTWSSLADGTPCGVDGVCYLGGCVSGCEIGSVYYAINAPDPEDPCQSCQPGMSTSAWKSIADGTPCGNGQICGGGKCGTQCDIDAGVYASGATDPTSPCLQCEPGTSIVGWSNAANGATCGVGEICTAGSCIPGCFIDGVVSMPHAANPNNVCQTCQPTVSTSGWSSIGDGTACGNGQICGGGRCGTQCDVAGIVYTSGAENPTNACQACEPGQSTSAWTNAADGTTCSPGKVCSGGSCTAGCYIQATLFQATNLDPMNACLMCQPTTSTAAWSDTPVGSGCGSGHVCNAGTCIAGCYISEVIQPAGTLDPQNACQSCQPASSTTGWIPVADGTRCAGGAKVCTAGTCVPGEGSGTGSGTGSGSGSGIP